MTADVSRQQKSQLYRYEASLVRVLDGDSIEFVIDLGFRLTMRDVVRLYGVNTPELHGATKADGLASKAFTEEWLAHQSLYITSDIFRPFEKYGRVLATVYREGDTLSLNDALVLKGLADVYLV